MSAGAVEGSFGWCLSRIPRTAENSETEVGVGFEVGMECDFVTVEIGGRMEMEIVRWASGEDGVCSSPLFQGRLDFFVVVLI